MCCRYITRGTEHAQSETRGGCVDGYILKEVWHTQVHAEPMQVNMLSACACICMRTYMLGYLHVGMSVCLGVGGGGWGASYIRANC